MKTKNVRFSKDELVLVFITLQKALHCKIYKISGFSKYVENGVIRSCKKKKQDFYFKNYKNDEY